MIKALLISLYKATKYNFITKKITNLLLHTIVYIYGVIIVGVHRPVSQRASVILLSQNVKIYLTNFNV